MVFVPEGFVTLEACLQRVMARTESAEHGHDQPAQGGAMAALGQAMERLGHALAHTETPRMQAERVLIQALGDGKLDGFVLNGDSATMVPLRVWRSAERDGAFRSGVWWDALDDGKPRTVLVREIDILEWLKAPIYRTGAAGRPSSMTFIHAEHEKRKQEGRSLVAVKQEAKALEDWIRTAHPEAVHPKAATIENNIRAAHRAWKSGTTK